MATVHIICGKSGSGKDTLVSGLLERFKEKFVFDTPYTSRPMREGEIDGVNYFFRPFPGVYDNPSIVEYRSYIVHNDEWFYWHTKIDEESLAVPDILTISTADTIGKYADAYGKENIRVYELVCSPDELLHRLIRREMSQKKPDYIEMVRRFTADEADWETEYKNPEKVCQKLGITYYAMNGERMLAANISRIMDWIFPAPSITLV